MPKQRNHPHHHSAAERTARDGSLQLPTLEMSERGFQRWRYPAGWVTRPFWRSTSLGVRIFGFVWAAILLITLVIAVTNR